MTRWSLGRSLVLVFASQVHSNDRIGASISFQAHSYNDIRSCTLSYPCHSHSAVYMFVSPVTALQQHALYLHSCITVRVRAL